MRRPLFRALQGLVLAGGSPLGWLALRVLGGADPWLELTREPGVYLYMLVGTALAFGAFGAFIGMQEAEHLENSLHDELTGLHNRRYFRRRLAEEHAFAVRHGRPLALLVGDIDYFKKVNDSFGHAAGDEVLVAIARAMMAVRRRGDTVARVGGEEFAVLLPETDLGEAVQVAERLRKLIGGLGFRFKGADVRVTMSLGASVSPPGQPLSSDALFRNADQAMYRAKRAGRDRVVTGTLSAGALEGPVADA